jgi:hypothetical protein
MLSEKGVVNDEPGDIPVHFFRAMKKGGNRSGSSVTFACPTKEVSTARQMTASCIHRLRYTVVCIYVHTYRAWIRRWRGARLA